METVSLSHRTVGMNYKNEFKDKMEKLDIEKEDIYRNFKIHHINALIYRKL